MEIAVGTKPNASARGNVDAHVAEVIGPGIVLLAIAEGFGTVRGATAPEVAVNAVRDALRRRVRQDGRDARVALITALSTANARVFAHSGSHDDHVASGTSISTALIVGDRAHIAHVGRTRAYLAREGSLMALTSDDELTGEGWSPAWSGASTDAMTGRVLTRTLGTQPTLDATVSNVRLMHGDAIVLASAAFHRTITDDEIAYTLRTNDTSESVTQRLLDVGRMRAGNFTGTVIVGRSLTEVVVDDGGRSFHVRAAALALTVLVISSLIAAAVFHAFVGP